MKIQKIPFHLIDAYQVMKFSGEEIDSINLEIESSRYWDLSNLWWDGMEVYYIGMMDLKSN